MAIMNIVFYLGQVYAYFCDFYPKIFQNNTMHDPFPRGYSL